ncbi:hypothetical protein BV898_05513 [Hypsibius exemplaris]|uniref:Activin types I and II receptor domain-containing protein n=1 Tax=Hypsibius exemplaris TaxID=2072580 RepID=A0A1W0WZ36_HYPEX|nr:hypothetical protein BV898_05513 [Hypsibius exemplaris]
MEVWSIVLLLSVGCGFAVVSGRFIDASASVNLVSCACNTQECRSQGTNRCMATNMCYVQYVPAPPTRRNRLSSSSNAQRGDRSKKDNYIRGCINRSTPLLCENRPPALLGQLQAEWPVLHCCSSDMCNKNVLPTPPVWMPTTTRPSAQDIYKTAEAVDQLQGKPFRTEAASRPTEEEETFEEEEERSLITTSNRDSAVPEVSLDSLPASEVLLNRIPIIPHSDHEEEEDATGEEPSEDTRTLSPNSGNLPAVVESATSDAVSLRVFYIGAPVIGIILVGLIIAIAVVAFRRNQFVSTESLVQSHGPKNLFLPYHQQQPQPFPVSTLHSFGSSSTGKKSERMKNFKGHDHVSYISGSSLDDNTFPEVFHGRPGSSYNPYYSSPTH